ncbi:MAG TPA: hypothetical protein VMV93_11295 [Chloroflexota bacterium]|nr:hypothetical protein [Chloroflexota bacterium]
MSETSTQRTELYEIAADMLRLQARILGLGLRVFPRDTRTHLVAALRETYDAAQATREHFRPIVQASLDELADYATRRRSAAPDAPPPGAATV